MEVASIPIEYGAGLGARSSTDALKKRQIFCPCREFEPRFICCSFHILVTIRLSYRSLNSHILDIRCLDSHPDHSCVLATAVCWKALITVHISIPQGLPRWTPGENQENASAMVVSNPADTEIGTSEYKCRVLTRSPIYVVVRR
jgi:hypothetical protein